METQAGITDPCQTCSHGNMWHLKADGPHPTICNFPGCRCSEFVASA